ncbi:hypothetical protein M5E89_11040 [Acidaminococcus intestini]|nr:hypothetical protein M5E89_11040 [Acidaminococcus intestini]
METYDRVAELDLNHHTAYCYEDEGEKVTVKAVPIDSVDAIFGELHPSDQLKYTKEVLQTNLERTRKTCSSYEFMARVKDGDGTYHWASFLLQGVKKGAAIIRTYSSCAAASMIRRALKWSAVPSCIRL